jgi:hypothetical protein
LVNVPRVPPSIKTTWTLVGRSLALVGAAALLCGALLGCGGGEQPPQGDDSSGSAGSAPAEDGGVAQPPPESSSQQARGDGEQDGGGGEQGGGEIAEDTETGPQPCPDVAVTPNSGNGLFGVEAEGITCEDASAALATWGQSGYPGDGPEGFVCEEVSAAGPASRLRCEQEASGGVVEFDTGT